MCRVQIKKKLFLKNIFKLLHAMRTIKYLSGIGVIMINVYPLQPRPPQNRPLYKQ